MRHVIPALAVAVLVVFTPIGRAAAQRPEAVALAYADSVATIQRELTGVIKSLNAQAIENIATSNFVTAASSVSNFGLRAANATGASIDLLIVLSLSPVTARHAPTVRHVREALDGYATNIGEAMNMMDVFTATGMYANVAYDALRVRGLMQRARDIIQRAHSAVRLSPSVGQ